MRFLCGAGLVAMWVATGCASVSPTHGNAAPHGSDTITLTEITNGTDLGVDAAFEKDVRDALASTAPHDLAQPAQLLVRLTRGQEGASPDGITIQLWADAMVVQPGRNNHTLGPIRAASDYSPVDEVQATQVLRDDALREALLRLSHYIVDAAVRDVERQP
jgi:hypothetical protein